MKNLLIIYNVVFLLIGNVLFSNIHYFHNHNHNHSHNHEYESEECLECIVIDQTHNYTEDYQKVNFYLLQNLHLVLLLKFLESFHGEHN